MRGFILTGTPGSGKTAVLRQLEVDGHAVVEEAATDVIALGQALGDPRPWERPDFAARILRLQNRRASMVDAGGTVFFDRSPVCTLALCRYAKIRPPDDLLGGIGKFERTAFLVRNLGFVEPTAARRISFADSLVFERIHEEVYRELGFTLVEVPPAPVAERVALIEALVEELIEPATRVRP